MGKEAQTLRISAKGQIVIPARIRRKLNLSTGQVLRVQTEPGGGILLRPAGKVTDAAETMLNVVRKNIRESGRNLIEELHDRRGAEPS